MWPRPRHRNANAVESMRRPAPMSPGSIERSCRAASFTLQSLLVASVEYSMIGMHVVLSRLTSHKKATQCLRWLPRRFTFDCIESIPAAADQWLDLHGSGKRVRGKPAHDTDCRLRRHPLPESSARSRVRRVCQSGIVTPRAFKATETS